MKFGGGSILVTNILKEFISKIDFLTFSNNHNETYVKKFLNDKKIKLKKIKDRNCKYIIKKDLSISILKTGYIR